MTPDREVGATSAHDRALAVAGDRAVTEAQAVARARALFLDDANTHGCAETAFVALKEAFGLPNAADSSAAMALNGGIAYGGGTCGAVTGAALAVGMLAARQIPDHRAAKRVARLLVADLLASFGDEFGSTDCRELIKVDLRTEAGHRSFIESGVWRDRCMRQLELAVTRLAPLGGGTAWAAAVEGLEHPDAEAPAAPAPPAPPANPANPA